MYYSSLCDASVERRREAGGGGRKKEEERSIMYMKLY